jgi:Zn-dependent peptidase ImmA (M78 family)
LGKILLPPGSDVDKFAEELIMPENMIRAIGASHRDVREFANAFGVTQQQMTRRMEDIGYRVSFCRILP